MTTVQTKYMRTASHIIWTLMLFGYRLTVKLYLIISLRLAYTAPIFH
jgi:hypothetical protein